VWVEGALYWRLLARDGMFNARAALSELAAEIPFFHVAAEPIPELGVDLRIHQLAGASGGPAT